jgi:hypothetical protein
VAELLAHTSFRDEPSSRQVSRATGQRLTFRIIVGQERAGLDGGIHAPPHAIALLETRAQAQAPNLSSR